MVSEGFLIQEFGDMLSFSDSADVLLSGFRSYMQPPRKWSSAVDAAARP
jgi:hypothetical protein